MIGLNSFSLQTIYKLTKSISKKISKKVLSLPIHPFLKESEIPRIINKIKDFIN